MRRGEEVRSLDDPRLGVALLAPRDLDAHAVAGHGSAHEDDELVEARDALPAVGEGGDVELDDVSRARRHGRQCTRCLRAPRTGAIVHLQRPSRPVDGGRKLVESTAGRRGLARPSF